MNFIVLLISQHPRMEFKVCRNRCIKDSDTCTPLVPINLYKQKEGRKLWQVKFLSSPKLPKKEQSGHAYILWSEIPSFFLWKVLWVQTSVFCGCPVTWPSVNFSLYKSASFVLVKISVLWVLLVRMHPGNEYCAYDLMLGRSGSNAWH